MKTFKITALRDDEIEAFGAYLSPSIKRSDGIVLLNIEALVELSIEYDVDLKELIVETLMHEIGHALEEWYDLSFDEDRIDRIINSFRDKLEKQTP